MRKIATIHLLPPMDFLWDVTVGGFFLFRLRRYIYEEEMLVIIEGFYEDMSY